MRLGYARVYMRGRVVGPALALAVMAFVCAGTAEGRPATSVVAFVGDREVFVVEPDGTGLRQLTTGDGKRSVVEMAWTPDGTRLVFERREPSGFVNADGLPIMRS